LRWIFFIVNKPYMKLLEMLIEWAFKVNTMEVSLHFNT
jgi:hypothetical protein